MNPCKFKNYSNLPQATSYLSPHFFPPKIIRGGGGLKSDYYVLLLILKIVATIFSLPVARDRNLFANCCLCALAHKAVSFNIKIVQ